MSNDSNVSKKIIASNKKARFDYIVIDTIEAGIVLQGTEVKALREGRANLKDSYCAIERDELYMINSHISSYSCGGIYNHEPRRKRKLLIKKKEIHKLQSKLREKGLTLVPLSLYFNKRLVKVDIAIAKGKKTYDKRDVIRKKEENREIARVIKEKQRYNN